MQVTDPIQDGSSDHSKKVFLMKQIFPPMNDRPESFMPFATFGYWIFAFVMIPLFMPLIGAGLWNDTQFASWLDLVYHGLNAGVVVYMLRTYFWDSLLNVQLYTKSFIKTVGMALLLMLTLTLALAQYFLPVSLVADAFPINEMGVAVSPGIMIRQLPVFGTLCHVLFAPVVVVGLFYAVGFAPFCCRKTWLGYLMVTFLLMLPPAFDILWRGDAGYVIPIFLVRLPMHWIACWSYQKADTVWAPLATLSIFNLATSLLGMILL